MQRDLAFSHYRAAAAALVLSSFFPLIPPPSFAELHAAGCFSLFEN
jgi:hypothetical protein